MAQEPTRSPAFGRGVAAAAPRPPRRIAASPHALWTEAEIRQWFARLPARERRRVRWAAIHAGCASTEWQRLMLTAAKFLLAMPVGVCFFYAGPNLLSAGPFMSAAWVVTIALWAVTFSPMFLTSGLLFLLVREVAVRTARIPVDEEFEVLLNRVYPMRRRFPAASPSSVPVADRGDDGAEHPGKRDPL